MVRYITCRYGRVPRLGVPSSSLGHPRSLCLNYARNWHSMMLICIAAVSCHISVARVRWQWRMFRAFEVSIVSGVAPTYSILYPGPCRMATLRLLVLSPPPWCSSVESSVFGLFRFPSLFAVVFGGGSVVRAAILWLASCLLLYRWSLQCEMSFSSARWLRSDQLRTLRRRCRNQLCCWMLRWS